MSNKQKIDPKLEALLDELRDVPVRDPRRAAQGRAQFLSQAVSVRTQTVSRNPLRRLNGWFDKYKQPKEKKGMTTFASIMTVLALLLGGGAGTVYASQESMPNEMLYPVKIASEEFRLNMAGDSVEEFALMLEFAQRRGDEIETMMGAGVEPTAENMLQLAQQTQMAAQLAGTLDGAAQLQAQNMIQNQMQRMLNLQENASEEGAILMEQTRAALQMQFMLAGGAGPGQEQDQGQEQGQEQEPGQGQGQGGPSEEDQGQSQGEPQGQGPADGSGQPETVPGAGNADETGEQFQNQGEDPCAAYYASLAQGASQENGGSNGKKGNSGNSGQGSQGESQGPVVYGLNGEVCVPPTVAP
ncbi:MAG: hypothetical protein HN855_05515 [Anaerolineae bacterium]|jgi:hypothetical protein|nr:hypothetical protein [Anaerolineae bacterium]MBT7072577.1 hypothetical protein [Anaerolineae bacterium]MBT7324597.1 hypothetical protein [Anaerolineae bacterium]